MAKRGRKPKSQVALQVNINTIREVSAVVFIVLGLVTILALFNAGGRVGAGLKIFAFAKFGIMGVILPMALIILGFVMLSPDTLSHRKKQVIGGVLGLFILTALLSSHGGVIGNWLIGLVQSGFGDVGAYLFLIALLILDLIICFNISPRNIFDKLSSIGSRDRLPRNVRVIEPGGTERVSVFTTVKRKIGFGRRPEPAQNQMPLPVSSSNMPIWEPPPIDLLSVYNAKPTSGNIAKNVEIIRKKLGDFSIDVTMGDVNVGPTVTQYQVKPAEGVKINQISSRSDDLALALAAHPIRVEAPIPGKSAVGVEVPNKVTAKVSLREILQTNTFKNRQSNLSLALGLDVAGAPIVIDLAKLPHLLIAGATGSGKSVCINAIITGLMYQNSPNELRFILVDPKRVEFTSYNGIPYLLSPVIVDVDKTVNILKWAVAEMERRFRVFQEVGARDLESYNKLSGGRKVPISDGQANEQGKIPNIIIIIDELSDLMAQAANEVEGAIVRLAQMARATGIHLVIATQRPSVNVITGLIKANVPARIAFAVASQIDSRTIIDQAGAEKLLGNGDMLYLGGETTKPKRIQGVLLSEKEIKDVTDFLKRNGHAVYDQTIMDFKPQSRAGGHGGESEDPMYNEAKEVVVHAGKGSASLLQRRLKVGYARAARLLDILEENGVIGPADGAKPRDVYLDSIESEPHQSVPKAPPPNYGPQFGTGGSAVTQYEHKPSGYGHYDGFRSQKDDDTEPKEAELPPSVPRPSAPPPEPDIPPAKEPESDQPLIRRYGSDAEKLSDYKEPAESESAAPPEPEPTRVYHPPERHLRGDGNGSSEVKEVGEGQKDNEDMKENEKMRNEELENKEIPVKESGRFARHLGGGPRGDSSEVEEVSANHEKALNSNPSDRKKEEELSKEEDFKSTIKPIDKK